MKSTLSTLVTLLFLYSVSFSQQSDCGLNTGFEYGTFNGWVCYHGYYGAYGAPYAPCAPTGSCPRFSTIYNGPPYTPVNSSGMNAPLTSTTNRHTIVNAAGGKDPNTDNVVPMLCPFPGSGNYSCRLGNDNTGTVTGLYGFTQYPQAEGMRITFPVTTSNAGFTYNFAFVVEQPGHTFESMPSFEVVVMDYRDSIIPCGRYFVEAPSTSPGNFPCVDTAGFKKAKATSPNNGAPFYYRNWSSVALDLTGYINQNVSVEFRTTDCYPTGSGTAAGGCQNYGAGSHSAYAYIDCYCTPLTISTPTFCAGAASIQICAPTGYKSYSWPAGQPGITGSPTTQCVTVSNPVAGTTYTVNLVSVTGCPTKTTISLQGGSVSPASTTICPGSYTTLTSSGGTSYSWSTGATTDTIHVHPTTTTVYTVTATTASCPAVGTSTVTVANNLTASISPPTSLCPGSSAVLTASGGTNYSWSTGATTDTIHVHPTVTTTYTAIVASGTCFDTVSTTITMGGKLSASISAPTTICTGNSTVVSATGGLNYSWIPGGQTTDFITVSPSINTTYTAIVSNGTCADTVSTTVTIGKITASITPPPSTICSGSTVVLTASGGQNYTWSTGATGPSISITPTGTTTYSVFVSSGNCADTASTTVTVNPLPTPVITGNTSICSGATTVLTASGGVTYSWWNMGTTSQAISVNPTSTTSYTVTVTDANGCSNTTDTTVTPQPSPQVTANGDTICQGRSATLNASSVPAGVFLWAPGGQTSPSITVHPTSLQSYTVYVTDAAGCTGSAIASVTVRLNPVLAAITSPPICVGDSATLKATPAGGTTPYTYAWNPPINLSNPNAQNPHASPGATITYTVIVTDANGCTVDTTALVNVVPKPSAAMALAPPLLSCAGFTIPFTANGSKNAKSFYWTFGDGSTSSLQNPPPHTYPFNGTYTVTLTVSDPPCTNLYDTTVHVGDLSGYVNIKPANVFTPNGDNINDCFRPAMTVLNIPTNTTADSLTATLSLCVYLEVYDRWGIKMFETTDTEKCWNGKTKGGAEAVEGTYFYIAKFGTTTIKGYVELLRKTN